jgi:hypothetical protein
VVYLFGRGRSRVKNVKVMQCHKEQEKHDEFILVRVFGE